VGVIYGVKLELNIRESLFIRLCMGWACAGPSFVNSLKATASIQRAGCRSCVLGLALVVLGAKLFDLPPGAAGGMLAGR
jgi:putative transport protein